MLAMSTESKGIYDAPEVDVISITVERNLLQGSGGQGIDNPGGNVPGSGDGGDD